jgi:hypothetical protein
LLEDLPSHEPGRAAIGQFFATAPMDGDLTRIRLVPVRANAQPAVAAYAQQEPGGELSRTE